MSRIGSGSDDLGSEAAIRSIHLLDDDSDWLLFLFEYLSNAGYLVTETSSIEDAFSFIGNSHPDILIADRDFPELTETELIDQVRALSPVTRVILTTERPPNLPSLKWVRSAGVDLLVKPFDWTMLIRAVEREAQTGHAVTRS